MAPRTQRMGGLGADSDEKADRGLVGVRAPLSAILVQKKTRYILNTKHNGTQISHWAHCWKQLFCFSVKKTKNKNLFTLFLVANNLAPSYGLLQCWQLWRSMKPNFAFKNSYLR